MDAKSLKPNGAFESGVVSAALLNTTVAGLNWHLTMRGALLAFVQIRAEVTQQLYPGPLH